MSERKNGQKRKIINWLEKGRTLTTMEAFTRFGITKLTTRISELRRDGYDIVGETKYGTDRDGNKVRFNVYHLEKQE